MERRTDRHTERIAMAKMR